MSQQVRAGRELSIEEIDAVSGAIAPAVALYWIYQGAQAGALFSAVVIGIHQLAN
jgi:hypothetical protein